MHKLWWFLSFFEILLEVSVSSEGRDLEEELLQDKEMLARLNSHFLLPTEIMCSALRGNASPTRALALENESMT